MKLSIITINRNNAAGLYKTIESVVSQTNIDFEYIIIDGASTDQSVEIIKDHEENITYWVSEPDKGIYNAMNKGIIKANGEYCLFLNSGDWFIDEKVVADFYSFDRKEDIVSGNILVSENGETKVRYSVNNEYLNFDFFYSGNLHHQATFIKKNMFTTVGLYNENNKVISDFEFNFKALILFNCTYFHIDRIISYYDLTGISNQSEWQLIQHDELRKVIKNYLPLVDKSFQRLLNERNYFLSHEKDYHEYMNLKKGRFSLIIKVLLWIKRIAK